MNRRDLLNAPVRPMELKPDMTINELIQQFDNAGSFGAGRLATACNILENMIRDEKCTVFLALAGAVVPAGLRHIIADLIRERLIDALVSTGANMIHDLIEAQGGHHYKGHWVVDDFFLYKYHINRIYDIFVPEEDFVKADKILIEMFDDIAHETQGQVLSTSELMRLIGSRLNDPRSIVKSAYKAKVPIFLPAMRDSEFAYIHIVHTKRNKKRKGLLVDSFREASEMVALAQKSERLGMIVIGGGVPRNAVQHAALMADKGLDYAVIITTDRPEYGGLSGSTPEETISWGKLKKEAGKVMVIGDAMIIFPLAVAAVLERLGKGFQRKGNP
ncbi:MAG: deoxyhypusine synthase family protein [Candidatus Bathyarchaeota archaeon]|nr:deoxyhypusine synthase family protein [Candidatus Bathyarchaeota archaeon]